MIKKRLIKMPSKEDFSSYEDILLNESDLNYIKKVPLDVMRKLYSITEFELSKKLINGMISVEEVQGALIYSKYLKSYFNK